ncbi:retrovirus-related pol polyprotein from transposon TNT 1-94 [Tanacetum coccineum]
MESYYSRFYKLMNELTRNNLQVTTMQVNVQFLQQLQPEWSRFVTVVKQSKEIDTISYHTLFDILKQYQNEVNDIRAERIAKSANPLALLAVAQPYSDNYYEAPKPQRSNATSSSIRPSASTRQRGKEIAKPVTPQSKSVSEEDSDPEQAQRDKDMQKNLALLTKKPLEVQEAKHGKNYLVTKGKDDDVESYQRIPVSTEQPLEQQLKKANASLTQELKECRTNLDETGRALGEATSCTSRKSNLKKPCLYEIPYDTSDLANRFGPNREETMTLANESRSKLNKDYVKPYDYTKQNSLYEIFKAPSLEYLYQLERAKEVRKTMWRTHTHTQQNKQAKKTLPFYRFESNSKQSRQVFNDMTFNINQFREIVDQAWFKHTSDYFRVPTAKDMEVLIKTLLMPLSIKTQNDSFCFEHELKTEMHEDYEYVKSLEKEVDELESEKADFSNIYDLLLEEFKECECLAQKFSKQTESVNKEVHNKLLKSFAKLENHSTISAELDLKAQMQDKNIAISELKKLIEKCKGNPIETCLKNHMLVRTTNAQTIVQLILFIVDSGCTKHMTGNLKLLCNFVEKFLVKQKEAHLSQSCSKFQRKAEFASQTCVSQCRVLEQDTPCIFQRRRHIGTSTFTPRTPEQNCVVERRNRTLVEAARMMLSASKLPLSFWAEAVATACYTQNRSIIISTHGKTAYLLGIRNS